MSAAACVGAVGFPVSPTESFTVGFGYVPARSPPAEPFGGSAVGICPNAAASCAPEPFATLVIFFELFDQAAAAGCSVAITSSVPVASVGATVGVPVTTTEPSAAVTEVTEPVPLLPVGINVI